MLPTEELLEVIKAWDELSCKKTQLPSPNSATISKKVLLKLKHHSFFSAQEMGEAAKFLKFGRECYKRQGFKKEVI